MPRLELTSCVSWVGKNENNFTSNQIVILGFATDGAPGFLKTGMHVTEIPSTEVPDCPQEFVSYFSAKWAAKFLCIQDAWHMVVKGFRTIMNKDIPIGCGIASRSILLALVRQPESKLIVRVSEAQLSDNKDRMNFMIASKVCCPTFTDELKRREEKATKGFLVGIQHIDYAYIDPTTTPEQRIFSGWYTVFFFRLLRFHSSTEVAKQAAFHPAMQKNSISSNLQGCIELNAHVLLMFLDRCRQLMRPDLFIPSNLNSQGAESSFRLLRSMSSTRSTVVSLDLLEIAQRSKRLCIAEEAPSTIEEFTFKEKKTKDSFIPNILPTNAEVNCIVNNGFEAAKLTLSEFRKFV